MTPTPAGASALPATTNGCSPSARRIGTNAWAFRQGSRQETDAAAFALDPEVDVDPEPESEPALEPLEDDEDDEDAEDAEDAEEGAAPSDFAAPAAAGSLPASVSDEPDRESVR